MNESLDQLINYEEISYYTKHAETLHYYYRTSTNGAGTTRYTHVKELNWTPTLHHMQK